MIALPDHVHAAIFTDHEAVAQAFRDGVPVATIAERFGLSRGAVKSIRQRLGVRHRADKKPRYAELKPEQKAAIRTLYLSGLSMGAVAKKLGLSSAARVQRELRAQGVPLRHLKNQPRAAKIVQNTQFDEAAFCVWATARGYSEATAIRAAREIRRAVRNGITTADEIDECYAALSQGARAAVKTRFRMFEYFIEATA